MHSKFDSDDEEGESGDDRGPSPPPSLLTGYVRLPSDEDQSDQEQRQKKNEEEEAKKEDEDIAENQSTKLMVVCIAGIQLLFVVVVV